MTYSAEVYIDGEKRHWHISSFFFWERGFTGVAEELFRCLYSSFLVSPTGVRQGQDGFGKLRLSSRSLHHYQKKPTKFDA
jgi:hypothetical protein